MTDPGGILWGAIAGAMIVLSGGFYALFFALGRLQASRLLILAATLCYCALLVATFVLARALNFTGFWVFVAAVMVIGYYFAPRAIWSLCVGTHEEAADPDKVKPSTREVTQ